jgi:hypothetical protein
MGRILKVLAVLVVLSVAGVLGYAFFGDMDAHQGPQSAPVDLNVAY